MEKFNILWEIYAENSKCIVACIVCFLCGGGGGGVVQPAKRHHYPLVRAINLA
jgi:hypothetical protein